MIWGHISTSTEQEAKNLLLWRLLESLKVALLEALDRSLGWTKETEKHDDVSNSVREKWKLCKKGKQENPSKKKYSETK